MPIEGIDPDLCNGCGICVDSCPMDVIRINEENDKAIVKYRSDCMACNFCELDCPAKAITISLERVRPLTLPWG